MSGTARMSGTVLTPVERTLIDTLRTLRFGSVEIVVHEGRVVRIEKSERIRVELDPSPGEPDAKENESVGRRPQRRSSPAKDPGGIRWTGGGET